MCEAPSDDAVQEPRCTELLWRRLPGIFAGMEYRLLVLLLATQTATCVAELTGDNVCPTVITETVSLRVKVKVPVTIKEYTWCFRLPPRCSKYRVEMRDKFKIQYEPRSRPVAACCEGYGPDEQGTRCVALCPAECVRGACRLPGSCSCEPGYAGLRCDSGCEAGWFGAGCSQRCRCDNGANCSSVTGQCHCAAGWRGDRCDLPCPEGAYGEGCSTECRCGEPRKCHHVTGECELDYGTHPEEATSEAAAQHLSSDLGEPPGTTIDPTHTPLGVPEELLSTWPEETTHVELPSTNTRGSHVFRDDVSEVVTTTTTAKTTMTSTERTESVGHLEISPTTEKEEYSPKELNLLSSNDGSRLDKILSLPESSTVGTERPNSITTWPVSNVVDNEGVSHGDGRPPVPTTTRPDITLAPEVPGASVQEDVLTRNAIAVLPDDDLQRLRQVKATEAGAPAADPEDGGGVVAGGNLLSTSCASAAVAVALIVTATLIVAAAHWRRSSRRKKASSGGGGGVPEQPATLVFAYSGTFRDTVFSAQQVHSSQVSVKLDNIKPEHNPGRDTTSTLQRDELKRCCDCRDSMTSHYDIPPPARLSLPRGTEGKSSEGEPIYEEIPGWGGHGASTFLTFAGVIETSRV